VSPLAWQIVNVATLALVLVANGLGGSGALSGESIGMVANRYPSYFLPAGWVFGIWSLIYLWLTGFVVWQALPAQRRSGFVDRVGPWWLLNGVLNIGWVVAFSFSRFGIAMALIIGLLVSLVMLNDQIGTHRSDLSAGDRLFGSYPFDLYLAWVSVAVIANASQYLTYLGWGGWGIPGRIWSVIMMTVATALGLAMVSRRGVWLFPFVVGWALVGIGDRYAGDPLLVRAAWGLTALGLAGLAAAIVVRGSTRGTRTHPPE